MHSRYPDYQRHCPNQYHSVGHVNELHASDNSLQSRFWSPVATPRLMPDLGATRASVGLRGASGGASTNPVFDEDTVDGPFAFAAALNDIKQNVQVNERLLRDLVESLQMWVFDVKPPSTATSNHVPPLTADQITMQCAHMVAAVGQVIDSKMTSMEQSMNQELKKHSINLSMAMMNAKDTLRTEVNSSLERTHDEPPQSPAHVVAVGNVTEGMFELQTSRTDDTFQARAPQDAVQTSQTKSEQYHHQVNPLGMKAQRARLARHMQKLIKARETQHVRAHVRSFVRKHMQNQNFLGFVFAHTLSMSPLDTTHSGGSHSDLEEVRFKVSNKLACCFTDSPCFRGFVESSFFSSFSMIMILSNAVWIAFSDDYIMKEAVRGNYATPKHFDIIDKTFAILFAVELALRIAAYRCKFFVAWDWRYNVFDSVIVVMGLMDGFTPYGVTPTMLRVVRILRVLRMFKVFRSISAFTELQQLLCAVTNCSRTLLWTLFIFGLVTFMCAITCMELLLSQDNTDAAIKSARYEWFSSYLHSMETVIMIATFGVDWKEVASPVNGPLLGVIMFFMLFMAFVFMPIVVGTHAMRVTNFQKYEPYVCIQRKFQDADTFIDGLKSRCRAHGFNMQDRVSIEALAAIMDDPDTEKFLLAHELEFQVSDIFNFFDLDDLGKITVKQFVYGCHFLTVASSATDSFFLGEQLNKVEELVSVTMDRVKTMERTVAMATRKPIQTHV